ncbi:hypothetical protein AXF42_Ash006059 [Apostasia shenzhenica]|uniref:Uncharacterized protein n=1 Tax=Apostasia shenzhenica TaxID=1088818 RepID=A0A2I0B041_9ASPA|nr:hypothetical protein AXF42_Ash006059 [Apostasia shenzhenica]
MSCTLITEKLKKSYYYMTCHVSSLWNDVRRPRGDTVRILATKKLGSGARLATDNTLHVCKLRCFLSFFLSSSLFSSIQIVRYPLKISNGRNESRHVSSAFFSSFFPFLHYRGVGREEEHQKETHGKSNAIDESTPIDEVQGPGVIERAKEEVEAIVQTILPKKDQDVDQNHR